MNNKILGIIGGGQLGKMMLQYCSTIGLKTKVYDSSELSVCSDICSEVVIGDFMDYNKIMNFGRKCSIITFELENICVQALKDLENEGIIVFPSPSTLETIQDKYLQKIFLKKNNIPTCSFIKYNSLQKIKEDIINKKIKLPCVWKKTTSGYDGFGVKIINNINDIDNLININYSNHSNYSNYSIDSTDSSDSTDSTDSNDNQEYIIEDMVNIHKELSIIVARNPNGDIATYSPLEMVFNNSTNQLNHVFHPSIIPYQVDSLSKEIAKKIVTLFNYVGVMAIEMFYTYDNRVLVNEIAPRPHNSGHLTIESCCSTSQFEQHIRAILGMPLGDPYFNSPACMFNIIGDNQDIGIADYNSVEMRELINMENTYVHIYGKLKTHPNRKLGHVTILGKGKPSKTYVDEINKKTKIKSLKQN